MKTDKKSTNTTVSERKRMKEVLEELQAIREEMVEEVAKSAARLDAIHANYRQSAENLLHYLVLRRRDRRQLQQHLAVLGLSSLGRSESHVLATIDAVIRALHRLQGKGKASLPKAEATVDFAQGEQLLQLGGRLHTAVQAFRV